ncbi:hypothetical protein O7627_03470 [Solwaraspora sp. WMMD1047]|uniref:hypothetical protein n=1 Tax=Solwaraspora sp. WMMD1047 TaxID=3016102 RepID=UPI002416C48F|nr:hypothetical protein [Solwaraspora sp. WMMD1047]MDG4828364.1 hypothetical protein [Solwaraspora sp. WMMD1047]
MDETGQPGAAAPGENGNGAGTEGEIVRPDSGWATADAAWSGAATPGAEAGPDPTPRQWGPPVEPVGVRTWTDPLPRYGTRPVAFPGAARPGRPVTNGASYPEPTTGRSAAGHDEVGNENDDDLAESADGQRLVVPAPRPVPTAERVQPRFADQPVPLDQPSPYPTSAPPVSSAAPYSSAGAYQSPYASAPYPSSAQPAGPASDLEADPFGSARHSYDDPPVPPTQPPRWQDRGRLDPISAPPTSARPRSAPPAGSGGVETPPNFRALPSSYRPPERMSAEPPRPGRPRQDRDADPPSTGADPRSGEPAETEPELGAPSPPGPSAWSSGWAPPWASLAEPGPDTGNSPGPDRLRDDWSPSWSSSPAADRSTAEESSEPSELADQSADRPTAPLDDRPVRPAWADAPAPYSRSGRARIEDPAAARPPWQPIAPTYATGNELPAYQPAELSRANPPNPSQSGYPYRPDEPAPADPISASRAADPLTEALPQRVPAAPDVPTVPEPPAVDPPAETPELARIATHLRRDDDAAEVQERPEGFDVNAILAAVHGVDGVREASLRTTPAGAHSLRLDLADGADPAEVSRQVARLLQDRMGLAAAPQNLPGPAPASSAPASDDQPQSPGSQPTSAPSQPSGGQPQSPGRVAAAMPSAPGAAPAAAAPVESRTDADKLSKKDELPESVARTERSERAGSVGRGPRPFETAPQQRSATKPAPAAEPSAAAADEEPTEAPDETPRRRRGAGPQGRAAVDERLGDPAVLTALPSGPGPQTTGTSYSGGQITTTEAAPSRPLPAGQTPGPRVLIDHVQVSTFGLDATVEVRLAAGEQQATGLATGPAVDGYVLRLCAVSAAAAVDELLRSSAQVTGRGRCFVEHAAVVPFGSCEVATVVVLLVCDGWVEQLAGSALVAGDPRQAVVRATLAAVNRRLEALLA